MDHDRYEDSYIHGILSGVVTIAVVGVSANASRPSYFAFKYLLDRGYRMIAVNPGLVGQTLLGQPAFASLADIPERVDMVDIFRAAPLVTPIIAEVLLMQPRPRIVWMQLGVRNNEAARLAEDNGMAVVMNRCPKIEYGRLSSEISWMGVNSRTLSSRRAQAPSGGGQRLSLGRSIVAGSDARHGRNS
jgi:predicted CoA-binding protein